MSTKNVGIITCHAAYNYGAALQAYGLSHAIKSLGYKAEHIDFRQAQLTNTYRVFQPMNSAKNLIRNFLVLFTYKKDKARAEKFEKFMREDLCLSSKRYSSLQELEEETFDYSHYICGSDQIWNRNLFIDSDAYYLSFVKNGKKIAYAPSMGNAVEISEKRLEMIKSFDFISVREESGRKYLLEKLGYNCDVVIDPTFLLEKSNWDDLAGERIIKDRYLYFYTVGEHQPAFKVAEEIAEKLHIKVVVSQTCGFRSPYPKGWIKCYESGPREFLNYIKYADFVVASSFHGTAFSVIFNTPFYAYRGDTDRRMSNLLNKIGLSDRFISPECVKEKLETLLDIDFSVTATPIAAERSKGIEFLRTALKTEKE